MKHPLAKFYDFLDRPITWWSRILLALLVIPLLYGMTKPLWRIGMKAPQYPKGLSMEIYAYKLESGHGGQDLKEINTLNHYIGMHKIDRSELGELDWMPFAIIAMALLALRCAAIGNIRILIDLAVISAFIAGYSMARFVYKMYTYGHHLDPTAPLTVKPFTPALLGKKQIANFATEAYPQAGTYYLSVFLFGVAALTLYHLVAGRIAAVRAARLEERAVVASANSTAKAAVEVAAPTTTTATAPATSSDSVDADAPAAAELTAPVTEAAVPSEAPGTGTTDGDAAAEAAPAAPAASTTA